MASTKVFSGSQAGKVEYPYDAMVYIDGTTVYAVDKEGNVIKRGVAGTDDATVIQAAIDFLSTGGSLYIGSGTYTINSTLTMNKFNIKIIGSGRKTTLRTTTGSTVLTVTSLTGALDPNSGFGFLIKDLVFHGAGGLQSSNLVIVSNVYISEISQCYFENALNNKNGIYLTNCHSIHFVNCTAESNSINMSIVGCLQEDYQCCDIIDFMNYSAGIYGINISGSNNVGIFGGVTSGCSNYGVVISNTSYNCKVIGHTSNNNTTRGITIGVNSYGCVVVGCTCLDTQVVKTQTYGIVVESTSYGNVISNNIVYPNGGQGILISAGTNNICHDNYGYVYSSEIRDSLDNVLEKLGTPRLLCPCVEITGTSVTDYTRNSNTLTAQASVATWYGYQGRATYYDFNGSSHYLYRTNDTDFDFGNSATDSAFSVVVAINPDSATSRFLIGKWDANNAREWRLFLDASGYPTLQLYDESVDKYIGRQDQTAFTTGSWKILVATYDGSGICAGCKIYIDGVQLDDADYTDAGYVAMEAVTANLMVGALKNAAAYSEYYDGKMTWIGIAAKELSADEVWSLTQRLKGVLGI